MTQITFHLKKPGPSHVLPYIHFIHFSPNFFTQSLFLFKLGCERTVHRGPEVS